MKVPERVKFVLRSEGKTVATLEECYRTALMLPQEEKDGYVWEFLTYCRHCSEYMLSKKIFLGS